MDPRLHSPNADLVRGKLVGLDAAEEKAKVTGRFDYDADIEGLRALDKCPHAFRIGSTAVARWVKGYKKNVYYFYPPWQYLDIDLARRKTAHGWVPRPYREE